MLKKLGPAPPIEEKISYCYANHWIQLFAVILGPFDIKIFFEGLEEDTLT